MKVHYERYQEVGVPDAIRTDNGVAFASAHALYGLSTLAVWWLRLGIRLEREGTLDNPFGPKLLPISPEVLAYVRNGPRQFGSPHWDGGDRLISAVRGRQHPVRLMPLEEAAPRMESAIVSPYWVAAVPQSILNRDWESTA